MGFPLNLASPIWTSVQIWDTGSCIALDLFSPGSPCIWLAQSGQVSSSGTQVPACDKRQTGPV